MKRWMIGTLSGLAVLGLTLHGCDKSGEAPPVDPVNLGKSLNDDKGTKGDKTPPAPKPTPKPKMGKVVAPDGAGFTVTFPYGATPEPMDQPVNTKAGPMTAKVWMAETSDGGYAVNYTELPAKLFEGVRAEKFVSGARDGALKNLNATLLEEKKYTMNGAPGLRFWYAGSVDGQDIQGRSDLLFAPPHLYHVQFIGMTKASVHTKKVEDFFKTFALTGDKDFGAKTLDSLEGGFSIAFPPSFPEPKTTTDESDTPAGKTRITMMMTKTNKGALSVSWTDVPGDGELTKKNFDDGRDGLLRNSGATLDGEEDFSFGTLPGRHVRFSGAVQGDTFYGRADFIASGRRLYLIQALMPSKAQLDDPQNVAYFKSFALADATEK